MSDEMVGTPTVARGSACVTGVGGSRERQLAGDHRLAVEESDQILFVSHGTSIDQSIYKH